MPVQWCCHPTFHASAYKIGSKPTHPRGDRKIDHELATFINQSDLLPRTGNEMLLQEGDLLCRSCYKKERMFQRYHENSQNIERETYGKMDIDDRIPRRRRSVISNLGEILNSKFSLEEDLRSSRSKSSSDSEPDEAEQIYKQKKAKELLNQVFMVLGIPPLTDL